jgi:hypothetical protein
VGVTVSRWTAETENPSGKPWGYDVQTRIVREITSPDLQLYPIIEPDSQDAPEQAAQLARYFPNREPIDGSDADALKRLDVIVAHEYWMVHTEVLAAFDTAVGDGVGLLNIGGMGWASPGFNGDSTLAVHLTGFTEANGAYTNGPTQCQVLQPHEILGQLGAAKQLSLRPLGAYGLLPPNATPLMKVTDMSVILNRGPAVDNPNYVFYPVYISHLQKGKIIGITFAPFGLSNRAARSQLLTRSVRWLAGRPVQ